MDNKDKLGTQPYKGVRDFFPEDMAIQNYIFDTWRTVANRFGYVEYNASILEPAELYESKSSEEIVNEQTYTFEDRGGRKVVLRPEMTPTVSRMVAAKRKEYPFPLRWFSIANVFRYEKPQKGRLRDHMQLNVDIFGVSSLEAELELIELSQTTMHAFGAHDTDFIIKVNSRKILDGIYQRYSLDNDSAHRLSQLLDKKAKISEEAFSESVTSIIGENAQEFIQLIGSPSYLIDTLSKDNEGVGDIVELVEKLKVRGVTNIEFDPTIVRGFDYYTGVVFEIFDTSGENPRSLFGGGRYSNLIEAFGNESIEAVGYGFGDVVLRDFLETHNLLPEYLPPTKIMICLVDNTDEVENTAHILASELRKAGINTTVDMSGKKVGDQITLANKKQIPYIICIGPEEIKSQTYTLKHLETGKEEHLTKDELISSLI